MEAVDHAVAEQLAADQQYACWQSAIGDLARRAQALDDVAAVADRVHLLRLHRPRTYDILGSADADGQLYLEHGFAVPNGFIGTEPAQVLCGYHDDLTVWPCPDLLAVFGDPASTLPTLSSTLPQRGRETLPSSASTVAKRRIT